MKIKTNLVFLGFIRSLIWRDFDGSEQSERWNKVDRMPRQTNRKIGGLFATANAKTLYVFPWVAPKIEPAPHGFRTQSNLFERWADRPATEALKISIPANVKNLEHVGSAVEIEYTSDKFERPGDLKEVYNLYVHEYGNSPPAVFVNCPIKPAIWGIHDPRGRKLLSYRGLIL